MNRVILVVGLSLLWFAAPVASAAVDCVPSQGCAEDKKPPECCQPPPCEFFYELKLAKAEERALSQDTQRFPLALAEDDQEAGRKASNQTISDEMGKAYKDFAKCPPNHFYQRPPALTTLGSKECEISSYVGGEFKPVTLDEALAGSNSCKELVQAEYAKGSLEQVHCERVRKKPRDFVLQKSLAEQRAEAHAKVESLEGNLLQYWSACSVVADADTARQVADAGIEALKDTSAKQAAAGKKPPAKSAKRGAASARKR